VAALSLKQARLVCRAKRVWMAVMVPMAQPDKLEFKEPEV
jgi:hypothetical protein